MKFECGDLERALEVSELMPEAREHLKQCANCRREYRLWNEISNTARQLHEEWDTPALWSNIQNTLRTEPSPWEVPAWKKHWKIWSVAAAVLIGAGLLLLPRFERIGQAPGATNIAHTNGAPDRDFLTEQALQEVQRTEAAYRHSIDKLSELAQPKLADRASPVAANYKEKLLLLDSAISETRANLTHNRFNVRLQTELADLYREKQQTLQELLTRDQKN
jgi:hypothetical protein